jgi:uncharacterized protein
MTTTAQVAQDNAALVKRGYDAFSAGDMPTLQAFYHPEAAFYTVPQQKGDGVYRGRDAILAFFVTLFNESHGTFKSKPLAITAAGDRVFVFQEISGERNGYLLHEQNVMVFLIDGGAVREMREFIPPTSHIKDFWAA